MNILVVDSDRRSLDIIRGILDKHAPGAEVICCEDPLYALACARESEIDVAFLEVNMPELSGLDLGRYLQELNPYINLIYLSGRTDNAYEAMCMHASGYVMKPGEEERIRYELGSLRFPESRKKIKRVYAQTFGNFELFVDGEPVEFKYTRTKEIVAILINNKGAQTTNGEIIADLWEDDADPDKKLSYLCNLRQDLQNTFNRLKLDGIIHKQRGSMAIAVDRIECDLYEWLDDPENSRYKYIGDYMNQYSWAENVHAQLDEISYSLYDD